MTEAIIPFNTNGRLLAKARNYLDAPDRLILDGDQGTDILIDALPVADAELKLKIVLTLGTIVDEKVIPVLYRMMIDSGQKEALRHAAAVQLSLLAGSMPSGRTDALVDCLIADLQYQDPILRANAAFALGWEANKAAVPALIELLSDEDAEVQQAAVSALSNIRDDRLFVCLADRLVRAAKEQQRCILYHLCCFSSKQDEVARICIDFLSHRDPDLRYDALVVLDAVSGEDKPLFSYLQCLKDGDPRIREQALVYLAATDARRLKNLAPTIRPLLKDSAPAIRQAATRLLHHLCDGLTVV